MTREIFKKDFLDRFLPRDQREAKLKEFINLRHGGKSVKEYNLNFIELSKYAFFLVLNDRYEVSHHVTGVSEDLEEEC